MSAAPTTTLVAAARNEGPHLLEWIAHHRNLGFDRILVYDNDSADDTTGILSRLAAIGAVEHVLWPAGPDLRPQHSAYEDALTRVDDGWIAFFDIDEFLVLHRHASVGAFIADVAGDAGAIAVNWRVFGSGGRTAREPEPTLERFTRCGAASWHVNLHVKTIARRRAVHTARIHQCDLIDGAFYVNDVGARIEIVRSGFSRTWSSHNAQLNHYILRSRDEFVAKISRGRGTRPARNPVKKIRDDPDTFFAKFDRNEDLDAAAVKYLPDLKRTMADLAAQAGLGSRPRQD